VPELNLKATYPVRCGVCDYQAFVLEPSVVLPAGSGAKQESTAGQAGII
jgi:hypothetical protein